MIPAKVNSFTHAHEHQPLRVFLPLLPAPLSYQRFKLRSSLLAFQLWCQQKTDVGGSIGFPTFLFSAVCFDVHAQMEVAMPALLAVLILCVYDQDALLVAELSISDQAFP